MFKSSFRGYIITFLLLLLLYSCQSDEERIKTNTWYLGFSEGTNEKFGDEYNTLDFDPDGIIKLRYIYSHRETNIRGNYKINGDSITLDFDDRMFQGQYRFVDSVLKLEGNISYENNNSIQNRDLYLEYRAN